MLRFGRTKKYKASSICRYFVSVAILAFGLSVSAGQANGVPSCGTVTPNGNGGDDYVVSGPVTDTCTITTNDTLTVLNGGSIVIGGAGGNAVESTNTPTSIFNDGLISSSQMFSTPFLNTGTLGLFTNTGTVQGLSGTTAAFTNNGTIGLLNNNGGLITGFGTAITSGGTLTITNNGGVIQSTDNGNPVNSTGTLFLDNTNGLIQAPAHYEAVRFNGPGTINNTNGMIVALTGSAISIGEPLSGPLINTGGLLTSASDDEEEGTLHINEDMGNLTILGGTIINTDNTTTEATAVGIDDDQSGVITFDGVTIIADGNGIAQGYAFYFYEWDASINITSTTYVRGRLFMYCCGFMNLTTNGTIIGDITSEDDPDTITVNGGSVTGNISMLGDDDIFTLNGGTVTGNVDMGNDDDTFALNGGTLTGNIAFGSGNDTFTYAGGILNGNVDFGLGHNIFNVNGVFATGGRTFATSIGGMTDLVVGGSGNFTVDDPLDLLGGGISVLPGGTLFLQNGNLTGTGQFKNLGTTHIGNSRTLSAGSFDPSGPGTMIFDTAAVSKAMQTGVINLGASPADLFNQTVQVNFFGGVLDPAAHSLIVNGTGLATSPPGAVTDNSFLYDFGVEAGGGNQLFLKLTGMMPLETATTSTNNFNTANVLLNDLGGSTDPVILQIQQKLTTATSKEEFNEIIESTQQTIDQGNQVAAVGMTGAMFDLADGQLAMVNTGGGTGVGAGNELKGLHFWTQGFGGWADQGLRKGLDGYEADVRGVAMGVDTRNFDRDTVLGLSIGFASTNVASENANNTRTDVTSYQLMAYGNHELGGDNFITGMALYGWNENEQARFNVGGIPGVTAASEYDSWVGGLRGSLGHNFRFPMSGERATLFMLTPQLFSEYVHFSRDAYTETGAGGANIAAGDASQTILNLGVSLQAEWTFKTTDGGKLQPDIHVSYKYDAVGDAADTTSTFVAGGSTIGIEGVDPARSAFGVGVGLKFYDTSGWDFMAAYDYAFKDEYEAHSAFLRAAYEF